MAHGENTTTARWKLDDDIYKNIASWMGDVFEINKDSTNLFQLYNVVKAFYCGVYSLLHNDDKNDIEKIMQEVTDIRKEITKTEEHIDPKNPMKETIDDTNREKLWDELNKLYTKMTESLVKRGIYGETTIKYDASNAAAEFDG